MKKLLLFIHLMVLAATMCIAQNAVIIGDSMQNGLHPGRYFIEKLRESTNTWSNNDTNEAGGKHADARSLSFWEDRISGGTVPDSPFYRYSYMMKNYAKGICLPENGLFNGNWVNTGPKSTVQGQGRVYDMYVGKNDPGVMLMGCGNAGLWKSVNGGIHWQCVSDAMGMPAGAGIQSIAVNPYNEDEIYVATKVEGCDRRNLMTWAYGQGVWYTDNGGLSWNIDLNGMGDFQALDIIEYCPYKVVSGTTPMLLATNFNKIYQKTGTGAWVDITPALLNTTPLPIRDITWTTDIYGKVYISTMHNWVAGSYYGPKIIEGTYDTGGNITWSVLLEDSNGGNGFVFYNANNQYALAFETAYAGNGLLYMICCAHEYGPLVSVATEGHHTLYSYNLNSNVWSFEYAAPVNNVFNKNMDCMGIEVSPNSPNVLYFSETQPVRVYKDVTGWHESVLQTYMAPACHADIRKIRIYSSSNVNNPYYGCEDVVYWGNDGGLSKSVGNTFYNLNGNIITNEIYDVDAASTGIKRAAASFDNGLHAIAENNTWEYMITGDGFDAIYDKRFISQSMRLLHHSNNYWIPSLHTPTGIAGAGYTFNRPFVDNNKDVDRPFEYPSKFVEGYMYSGNRNMLKSSYMGYATAGIEWDEITNNGDIANLNFAKHVHCRAIAVTPTNTNDVQLKYFAFRNPDSKILNGVLGYYAFFATDDNDIWMECTPPVVRNGWYNITDVATDSKDPRRVFVSLGMVNWNGPQQHRVYYGEWNPINQIMTWTDMSSGLSQLPVTCLAYQNGSDDVIYAGTDGGVYRWDKPQGCWVPFDDMDAQNGGTGKMPHVIVHDLEIDYCNRKLVMGSYARGIWESDLYYPNFFPDPTEIITTNTTWQTDKVIEGSILVKSGATLSISGNPNVNNNTMTSSSTTIYMPKWGRIDVEKGAKLEIEGAHITNACDNN